MGEIKNSREYGSFRSSVSQKKVVVDDDDSKVWTMYDAGPRTVKCPIVCLPPVSGTADVFFRQIMALSGLGYRVIALQYPVYWSLQEWVDGFRKLLDHLQLDKIHLFGASLGGFLGQKFAEATFKSPRVHSMVLCNAFSDTTVFQQTSTAPTFWLMPAFMLKKMVMGNFTQGMTDPAIADSIDFLVDCLENLPQSELASRLTLNCQDSYVEPQRIQNIPITIIDMDSLPQAELASRLTLNCQNASVDGEKINQLPVTILDVFDESALSTSVKEELYKCYPNSKRAHLKSGGNFPYVSRSAEVNLYIQIHLREFHGTRFSAIDPEMITEADREAIKQKLETGGAVANSD